MLKTHAFTYPGSDLSPAEVEFATAVERYKRARGRRFPSCAEVLGVLVALGYRKVAEPTGIPKAPTRGA